MKWYVHKRVNKFPLAQWLVCKKVSICYIDFIQDGLKFPNILDWNIYEHPQS